MPQASDRSLATPITRPRFPVISGPCSAMNPILRCVPPAIAGLARPSRVLYTTRRGEATTGAPRCYPPMDRVLGRALHAGRAILAFSLYVLRRFGKDGCLTGAGALSYTTLVSLVPLIAIALATFSAFPIFENARDQLLEIIFNSLVPDVGEEVRNWLTYFVSSAAHPTAIGVLFLALSAILLLATIEDQLDAIWKVTSARPIMQRVLIYWTLLTLGPL